MCGGFIKNNARTKTSEGLSMTFTADGKRQRLKLSLIIHSKYKYFDSTAQRAEDRRQKFHFCRLPFALNVILNLSKFLNVFLGDTREGLEQ